MRPMLATTGTHVPTSDEWAHEVKWDGIRILADAATGAQPRLTTRNGNTATIAWPELVDPQDRDLLVDGEVIALNDDGLPDFRALAERMHVRDSRRARAFAESRPATYMVFDLLRVDGRDLTGLPWAERRALLEKLELGSWQVPAVYDDGPMLHDVTFQRGLEGIVSKRRTSRYHPGIRTREWLKFAHRLRRSYVVGGWRPQTGTTDRLAAVLVGEPTADGLVYRGRVGSGIGAREGRLLRAALEDATASPFAGQVPKEDILGTHWVVPRLVVDVETHGSHVYDRLRQPAFIAIRTDIGPEDLS